MASMSRLIDDAMLKAKGARMAIVRGRCSAAANRMLPQREVKARSTFELDALEMCLLLSNVPFAFATA